MPYFIPPEIAIWGAEETLNWWDRQKVKNLLPQFPGVFGSAVADWAKLKEGVDAGLFTAQQQKDALDWFREFPDIWRSIRPNYSDENNLSYRESVDRFVGSLTSDPLYGNAGLGIGPALVAGVLIVGGAAAALWAVEYIQRQANISAMIDGVVSGKLSPDILKKAIEVQESGGLFGGISGLFRWAVVGGLALYFIPRVWNTKK
jgi:hypothetical protein